jgi:hypothetical protein
MAQIKFDAVAAHSALASRSSMPQIRNFLIGNHFDSPTVLIRKMMRATQSESGLSPRDGVQ